MSKPLQVELERLRYWQGQRLRSRDFRDQLAIEAQLRWWHNRALHDAYGVSTGFIVSAVPTSGTLRALRVTCGLAYDYFGRELILQDTREIPVPPAPGEGNPQGVGITLLLRYKQSGQFSQQIDLVPVCLPCASASVQEEPDFVWQPSDRVQVTDGVPLARVHYDGQQAFLNLPLTAPLSRPLARPYLASGATLPDHTLWERWIVEVNGLPTQVGVETKIDTSAAGFTRTPCYFAWLQGALLDEHGQPWLFPYFANIAEASPTGFIFRILLPRVPSRDSPGANIAATPIGEQERESVEMIMAAVGTRHRATRTQTQAVRGQGPYVCWLGCQMEHRPSIACPGSMGRQPAVRERLTRRDHLS